ncbi:MAG TPA: hypothetical protein VHO01_11300 [Jatrophihabitans sp.]|nr:hypothetical protein [Jatrophihabitans sp.]
MTSRRRWLVVLAGIVVLLALPAAVAALPAPTAAVSAGTLLERIQASGDVAYSGYAESDGGLALPVTSQFSALADLLGSHTQLRVWWRTATDWRVDSIGYTGETDLHMTPQGWWTWRYEANSATFSEQTVPPRIRLPDDSDLLPPTLARRLLSQVRGAEVSSLPARRVAGENAPGLRVRPDQAASTIDHIDVWADNRTGLPLRISVYGAGSGTPAMTTSFLDVRVAMPAAGTTAFTLPPGASVASGGAEDLATALDQFGPSVLPASLAGIERNPDLPDLGAIGVYGRGVTEFAAVPLPRRLARSLRESLAKVATVGEGADPGRLTIGSGPLNLLLTSFTDPAGTWLLVGTVTPQTLASAAAALPERPR